MYFPQQLRIVSTHLAQKRVLLIVRHLQRGLQQIIDSFPTFSVHRKVLGSFRGAAMLVLCSSRALPLLPKL